MVVECDWETSSRRESRSKSVVIREGAENNDVCLYESMSCEQKPLGSCPVNERVGVEVKLPSTHFRIGLRRKWKACHVVDAHRFHLEHDVLQRTRADLRLGEGHQMVCIYSRGVEPVAVAGSGTACTTRTLVGTSPADPGHVEGRDTYMAREFYRLSESERKK